jgi:hypothetical protein
MKNAKPLILALIVLILATLACGSSDEVTVNEPEEEVAEGEVIEEEEVEEVEEVEPTATKKVGTARSNPAPVGSEVIADDMVFVILGATRPADDIIMAGNPFNTEPEEGEEYILVDIEIKCLKSTDDKCSTGTYNISLLGDSGISYDPEIVVVGVEGLLDFTSDFYGEAVISGSIPFIVKQSDTELLFVYEPLFGDTFFLQVP